MDHVALGGRDGHLSSQRRRALRNAGEHLDPVQTDADRAPLADRLVVKQRPGAVRRAGTRKSAQHRHPGRVTGEAREDRVGRERVGIRQQDQRRVGAQLRHPLEHSLVLLLGYGGEKRPG